MIACFFAVLITHLDEQSVESNVDSAQQDEEDSEDEEVAARRIMQQVSFCQVLLCSNCHGQHAYK